MRLIFYDLQKIATFIHTNNMTDMLTHSTINNELINKILKLCNITMTDNRLKYLFCFVLVVYYLR